jgi:D-methionine transport system ATP-binding protein
MHPRHSVIPIIKVDALSKHYLQKNNIVYALQGISFAVEEGDVYGIIGLSGAGKSTLIRCLARLVTPSSGKVLFLGQDLAAMNKKELLNFRTQMGMVFQHFNLLSSRTVEENILYPLEIAKVVKAKQAHRSDELLSLVGLKEKKHAYPSQLSGGEKQRVGIARALANHPKVLLCDEATSALDPKTTRDVLHLLKDINKKLGVTIVLITHDMEVIKRICNKVAVIEEGKIVEEGLVSEVFSDPQHVTTKHFLQSSTHEIPAEFFKGRSSSRKLLRLRFKGQVTGEPIISEIVRKFDVNANILLGWIDYLQGISLGTLVIELTGPSAGIEKTLSYLADKHVHYEEITDAL